MKAIHFELYPDILKRIRGEYAEMPGLSLNQAQAQRLFGVDPGTCCELLGALVDEGFLSRTARGTYLRLPAGGAGSSTAKAELRRRGGADAGAPPQWPRVRTRFGRTSRDDRAIGE
jgi:hypothetical protein